MCRVALDRAGIPVDNYLSAELDTYAIKVAHKNYPDNIHLGDVRGVTGEALAHWGDLDLLVGGSPCQDLSIASPDRKGLEGERSGLFWEYVRVLKETEPKYFLFENVRMSQKNKDIISDALGVQPIEVDSALLSAQTRKRLYWTNIPIKGTPNDKGLVLADILEDGWSDRDKAHCIDANYWKGGNIKSYTQKGRRQLVFGSVGRPVEVGHADDIKGHDFLKRVYSAQGKSPTLTTVSGGNQHRKVAIDDIHYRKLTPLECERLQTLPDGYTEGVSNTQRYKMLGNGFTVDVIAWFLEQMPFCQDCDKLADDFCMVEDPWGGNHGYLCEECNSDRAERATEVGG
jgi:DNA-cytosine methyltransferase